MKVRCIRLLDAMGREISVSPWLQLGHVYHVLSMGIDNYGNRNFGIVSDYRDDEWPLLASHRADCFEIVSEHVPSNWRSSVNDGYTDISPASWQEQNFYESFSEHEPWTFPVFEHEREVILREDP